MKENRISIEINRSIDTVFEFTTNPKNTPLWIEHLREEVASQFPPIIGTTYKNHGDSEQWDEYYVSEYQEGKLFTLSSKDNTYHVRYTYTKISDNSCAMEYHEWVDSGELSNPFTQSILEKLKTVIESR